MSRVRIISGLVALLLIAAGIGGYFYAKTLVPRLKTRVEQALSDRFDADVQLQTLNVSLLPRPRVWGEGLSIRHKQWMDPRPLIYIRHFKAATDFSTILDRRNTVSLVTLDGLEIHIPARGRSTLKAGMEAKQEVANAQPGSDRTQLRFLIQTIVATNTRLEIEPKKAGKEPLLFGIEELIMRSVGPGEAMAFTAKLTNPTPPGLIDTEGHFGPWQRDDPRSTAVSGDYTFRHADLGVFNGISGILSSTGKYKGVLQHIEADGETDTPNFALKSGGAPVHLKAAFHSVIDGTNGDTILDPVNAAFLNSEFVCTGGVVQQPGKRGKTVTLDAFTKRGRIEDILTLIVGGKKPLLTGNVNFRTKIEVPPGSQQVLDKLNLDGQFGLNSAEFTSAEVQEKLRTLSDRARGISKKEEDRGEGAEAANVASNLKGRFKLDNGKATFSRLSFNVPGAFINLTGSYDLRSEKIDMEGRFRMQATLSDTQSGLKQWMLKPLDPLFRKHGAGFELPLEVGGTKDHPIIGTTILHHQVNIH